MKKRRASRAAKLGAKIESAPNSHAIVIEKPAEVASKYELSPRLLERWRREWRAKGESAFPAKLHDLRKRLGKTEIVNHVDRLRRRRDALLKVREINFRRRRDPIQESRVGEARHMSAGSHKVKSP